MKLLGSIKCNITKDKNRENMPNSEITKVVLVHCNIVKNNYQQVSRVLQTLISNKSFGQLLGISPKKHLIQNFHTLKYHLLIKLLNRQK